MLLSSDLRGYISHPEYYFAADDETHRHWLDLLLMVQGWRRYDFREMAGIKPFELKEPVETGQLLTGHLVANHKRLKEGNVSLNVNIFFAGLHAEGSCKTDTLGNFAMMLPSYYGEGIGRFTAMADGKKKDMQLFLDRNFAPTPRMFDVQEMVPVKPIHSASIPVADTFVWQDTITKGDIMLGTAVVKGKLKDNPASWGDHWNGGEDFARRNADICSTIVFAHKNERTDIVNSIRDRYSVAVDSISKEYRLVGEYRFQKYASFLMENYFPIHDRAAAVDGEIMRRYFLGEESAEMLSCFADKAEAFRAKYIRNK